MERPWIAPSDVKDYSDLADVQNRSDTKLTIDIRRAESYIIKYTNNDFSDDKYSDSIPEDIRVADILLAEYFAHNMSVIGNKKSESFDDYSYTVEDSTIDVTALGLDTLLDPYVIARASGKVNMRMRKL
jgi:hypothetical protein